MGLKKFKQSKYVTYHDIPEVGAPATIVNAGIEQLDNYQTGQKDNFVVLHFQEFKPLVCKNPVLDALDDAFPDVDDPAGLIGRRIHLIRSDERVAGQMHQLVRVDALGTARLQGMTNASQPDPGATISDRPPAPAGEEPPPHTDADAAFGLSPQDEAAGF